MKWHKRGPGLALMTAWLAGCGGGGGGAGTAPDPATQGNGIAPVSAATRFVEGGTLTLVSRDVSGLPAPQDWQAYDGDTGVFASAQDDLVGDDGNGVVDVFGPFGSSGSLRRLSVPDTPGDPDNVAGLQPNGNSGVLPGFTGRNLTRHTVSAGASYGGYTAFVSSATNLVPNDTNGVPDVFVRYRGYYSSFQGQWVDEPRTRRMSVAVDGTQSTTPSFSPVVFGSTVLFVTASPLVATDTNGTYDVYQKDINTGNVTLISRPAPGQVGNGASFDPQAGDHFITFLSWADNLVPGDTNGSLDLFRYTPYTGALERVPLTGTGQGDKGLMGPDKAGQIEFASRLYSLSAYGRYVAFLSESTNLVPGDTNGRLDAFVYDFGQRQTVRISTSADGSVSGATLGGISLSSSLGQGQVLNGETYVDAYPMAVFTSDQPFMATQTAGSGIDVYARVFANNSVQRMSNLGTDSWPIVDVSYLHSRTLSSTGPLVRFTGAAAKLGGGTVTGTFEAQTRWDTLPP